MEAFGSLKDLKEICRLFAVLTEESFKKLNELTKPDDSIGSQLRFINREEQRQN